MKRCADILIIGCIVTVVTLALFFTTRYGLNHAAFGDGTYSNFMAARGPGSATRHEFAYSDLVARVERNEVRDVTIQGHSITGDLADGTAFQTYAG